MQAKPAYPAWQIQQGAGPAVCPPATPSVPHASKTCVYCLAYSASRESREGRDSGGRRRTREMRFSEDDKRGRTGRPKADFGFQKIDKFQ